MPFRRSVKQDGKVNGGMPADFKTTDHGLNKLKVATRGGVVFASFDHEVLLQPAQARGAVRALQEAQRPVGQEVDSHALAVALDDVADLGAGAGGQP